MSLSWFLSVEIGENIKPNSILMQSIAKYWLMLEVAAVLIINVKIRSFCATISTIKAYTFDFMFKIT